MLGLLGSGMQDTLAAVDLHADIQLEVNVPLCGWTHEAAVGGCAWPALAEQLADSRKARRLLVRCLHRPPKIAGRPFSVKLFLLV